MNPILKISAVVLLSSAGCEPLRVELDATLPDQISCSKLMPVSKKLSIVSCTPGTPMTSPDLPAVTLTSQTSSAPLVSLNTQEVCMPYKKGTGSHDLRCTFDLKPGEDPAFAEIEDFRIDIEEESRLLLLTNGANGMVISSANIEIGLGLDSPDSALRAVYENNSPRNATDLTMTAASAAAMTRSYFWKLSPGRAGSLEGNFRVLMACTGNGSLLAPPLWKVNSITVTGLPKVPDGCLLK